MMPKNQELSKVSSKDSRIKFQDSSSKNQDQDSRLKIQESREDSIKISTKKVFQNIE